MDARLVYSLCFGLSSLSLRRKAVHTPQSMGASHSRARPGSGPAKVKKFEFGKAATPPASGYFILSLKGDRIKVVNAEAGELKLLTMIIKRHAKIMREGWDRHLTYSYKLKKTGRHCMIQLVADFLLSLYQAGWEPMTPIDMGLKNSETGSGPQTAICFRRKYEGDDGKELFGSSYSLLSGMGSSKDGEQNNCLCLETFRENYLGFHDVSNTVLYEVVDTIQKDWSPGIKGISMAVSSVISDYTTTMPAVLPGHRDVQDAKYIQLEGNPWSTEEGEDDAQSAEKLQISIIACLSREGYKLSMAINMDTTSKVFFFIRDREESKGEVRIPNMAGAGLGEKDTLSVYRPMVVRSRSSFFRSYNGKTASVRRKVRASLRKKAIVKGNRQLSPTNVMAYKPQLSEPAWWQQTSTDVSSDHDDQDR